MPAYINPASVRVDVSDLMTWRDEAIRVAKDALHEGGDDYITTIGCCVAVAAAIDVICDGWKDSDNLMEIVGTNIAIINEEVF